jgi:hypothetical protein
MEQPANEAAGFLASHPSGQNAEEWGTPFFLRAGQARTRWFTKEGRVVKKAGGQTLILSMSLAAG